MSQTVITTAFEALKAQQAVSNSPVILDGFVFANVPGLNITDPIDPAEAMPGTAQIVHRADVAKTGVVNENAVVYSVTLGADIGDFEFNWVGLINKASNTLAMIVHAPAQQKVKNAAGNQGNVLTRSFLMEYDGAKKETQITTPAQTWQIDFTARLAGMDERVRVENIDVYGAAAFLGNGFLVTKSGNNYAVTAGIGYVGGLRGNLAADKALTVATKPMKVWADVSWKGTLTSVWQTTVDIQLNAALVDYVKDGIQHYVCAIAQINADGTVTDLRPKGPLSQQLAASDFMRKDKNLADVNDKAAARTALSLGDSATKNTGATAGTVAAGDDTRMVNAVQKTRKINNKTLDADVTITEISGNAGTATKLQTPRTIAGVSFDGTANINLPGVNQKGNQDTSGNAGTATKLAATRKWTIGGAVKNFDGSGDILFSLSEMGALPLAGGTMIGDLTLRNGGLIFPEKAYQNKALGRNGTYATPTLDYRWELYAQSVADPTLRTNIIQVDIPDISKGSATPGYQNLSTTTINLQGRIISASTVTPGDYSNFDARYQLKGNYTPANEAYTKAASDNKYTLKTDVYTKTESDGRFQPKGSYTPAGQAYTKTESDGRYNLKNTGATGGHCWQKNGSTGQMECYGTFTGVDGAKITFPNAFPSVCVAVVVCDAAGYEIATVKGRTTTGFTLGTQGGRTVAGTYIAKGY